VFTITNIFNAAFIDCDFISKYIAKELVGDELTQALAEDAKLVSVALCNLGYQCKCGSDYGHIIGFISAFRYADSFTHPCFSHSLT
jgi:hypothetical protein